MRIAEAITPIEAPKRRSLLRKIAIGLGIGLAMVLCGYYIFLCVALYSRQNNIAFLVPAQYAKTTPQDIGLHFEDLHIPVSGTEQIHAFWVPAASPTDLVVLDLHGSGGVIEQNFGEAHASTVFGPLHQLGVNLLLVEYRGYGSSSPTPPSEQHINEDAQAAYAYLTLQRHIPSRDIIIFGRSIGTEPAVALAANHPDAAGLILMSPLTCLADRLKREPLLRLLPLSLLMRDHFDNLSKISAVHIPVFITVGSVDKATPPYMARELFLRANQPKRLYVQPGAGHSDIVAVGGKTLETQIGDFIASLR